MTKRFKTALVLCMMFCLTLFCAVFAACKDPDEPDPTPSGDSYTVTVQDESGNPLSGVSIQFCVVLEDGSEGSCFPVKTPTDSKGVVSYTPEDMTLTYHIKPQDQTKYDFEPVTTQEGVYEYTLVLTEKEQPDEPGTDPDAPEGEGVSYTFNVMDLDGNPVKGAVITINRGTGGGVNGVTDENGSVTIDLGYFSGQLGTGGEQSFWYEADEYVVDIDPPVGYEYRGNQIVTSATTFTRNIIVTAVGTTKNYGTHSMVTAIISDTASGGQSTTRRVSMYTIGADTYDVLFEDKDTEILFYTFQTLTSGKYNISIDQDTLPAGVSAYIQEVSPYEAAMGSFFALPRGPLDENGDIIENATEVDFEVDDDHVGALASSTHTFSIVLAGAGSITYPVEFKITVERTGDPTPPATKIDVIMEPEALPEKAYEAPVGVLTEFPLTDAAGNALTIDEITLVLDEDGYYRIGTADGPYLLAKIVGASRYMDGDFQFVEASGNKNLHIPDKVTEENTQNIYDYTTFIATYSDYVNDDGVVLVNKEMRTFLERYAGYQGAMGHYQGTVDESAYWLIPCGYYLTESEEVAYRSEQTQPAEINGTGFYQVTIPAGGTAYIRLNGFAGYEVTAYNASGITAVYNEKEYNGTEFSFQTQPDSHDQYYENYYTDFTFTNEGTAAVTLQFAVQNGTYGTTQQQAFEIVEGVAMGVTYRGNALYYSFTAETAGLYAIRAYGEGQNPTVGYPAAEGTFNEILGYGTDGFLITLQLPAGTTVFSFGSQRSDGAKYSFAIQKVDAIEGSGTAEDPYIIDKEGNFALAAPMDNGIVEDTIYIKVEGGVSYNLSGNDFNFGTYPSLQYVDEDGYNMSVGMTSGGTDLDPAITNYTTSTPFIVTVKEAEEGTAYRPFELTMGGPQEVVSGKYYTITFDESAYYTIYTTNAYATVEINGRYVGSDTRGFTANIGGTKFDMETLVSTKLPVEAGVAYTMYFGSDSGTSLTFSVWIVEGDRPEWDAPDSGAGTESDPYVISKPLTYQAEIAADGTVYYSVNSSDRFTVTVEDAANVQAVYGGETFTAVDGVLTFTTEADGGLIAFSTADGAAATIQFSLEEYVVQEPVETTETELSGYELSVGENTVLPMDEAAWMPTQYYFVPEKSGEYELSVDANAQMAFNYSGNWGLEEVTIYSGDPVVVYLNAGFVYPFYSYGYADGTFTIKEVDTAYSTVSDDTGADEENAILLGGASGIGVYEVTVSSNATIYFMVRTNGVVRISVADTTLTGAVVNGQGDVDETADGFTYVTKDQFGNTVTFALTNRTNASVTTKIYVTTDYTITEPEEAAPEGTQLFVGDNTVTTTDDGEETMFYFIAEEAGTYTFSSTNSNLLVSINNGDAMVIPAEDLAEATLTLDAGDTVTIAVSDYNWGTTAGNCTLTIEKA